MLICQTDTYFLDDSRQIIRRIICQNVAVEIQREFRKIYLTIGMMKFSNSILLVVDSRMKLFCRMKNAFNFRKHNYDPQAATTHGHQSYIKIYSSLNECG